MIISIRSLNRSGKSTIYVNGIPTDSTDISTSTGSIEGTLPYYIGQDGTGTYASKMRSSIDEFRVWNEIRTQNQIRTYMCRKLKGDELGLLRYFRMDELSGTVINDYSSSGVPGTLENQVTGNRRLSGAALGDTSWFVYSSSWSGATGALTASNQGQVYGKLIEGNAYGFHIYHNRVAPLVKTGVRQLSGVNSYFGCFPVTYQRVHDYKPVFGYSNIVSAIANESGLALYYRVNAEMPFWSIVNQSVDFSTDQITADSTFGQKELYLGLKPNGTCLPPSLIRADSVLFDRSVVNWNSGGASRWNILWDTAGFISSTGNSVRYTNAKPYSVGVLGAQELYEVYIQDTCSGSASTWAGPYLISVKSCVSPDSLTMVSNTNTDITVSWNTSTGTKWVIEWGPKGFSAGTGIPQTVTSSPFTFSGLAANTQYDFYIKTECSSSSFSAQKGPYTFKTDTTQAAGVTSIGDENIRVMVYPNPHEELFQIVSTENLFGYKVFDLNGRIVISNLESDESKHLEVSSARLTSGVYVLEVITKDSSKRLIIQKQ